MGWFLPAVVAASAAGQMGGAAIGAAGAKGAAQTQAAASHWSNLYSPGAIGQEWQQFQLMKQLRPMITASGRRTGKAQKQLFQIGRQLERGEGPEYTRFMAPALGQISESREALIERGRQDLMARGIRPTAGNMAEIIEDANRMAMGATTQLTTQMRQMPLDIYGQVMGLGMPGMPGAPTIRGQVPPSYISPGAAAGAAGMGGISDLANTYLFWQGMQSVMGGGGNVTTGTPMGGQEGMLPFNWFGG